eukprot:310501-Pleurochrysis_carterae.AAC.1
MQMKLADALGVNEEESVADTARLIPDVIAKQHSVYTAPHRPTAWPLLCGFMAGAKAYCRPHTSDASDPPPPPMRMR